MGTHYEGREAERRALDAFIKLVRCTESLMARVHWHISPTRLTVGQFGILEALYHLGPLTPGEIGEKLLRSSGNITVVIDNLEKRGLIRRERSAKDRRSIIVHLTDEGRSLIQEIFPRHASTILQEMKTLTASEQAELGRLCRTLGLKTTSRKQLPSYRHRSGSRTQTRRRDTP